MRTEDMLTTYLQDKVPHIDPQWAREALIELDIRGVSGPVMGEALLEVDGHLASSGADTRATFGDPKEYVASLELPRVPVLTGIEALQLAGTGALLGVGVTLAAAGVMAVLGGQEPATFTVATAVVLAIFAIVFAPLAIRFRARAANVMQRHLLLSLLIYLATILALGTIAAFVPSPTITLTRWVALIGGVGLILVGWMLLLRLRGTPKPEQRLTFPGE